MRSLRISEFKCILIAYLFVFGSTAIYSIISSAAGGLSSSIFPWYARTVTIQMSIVGIINLVTCSIA